MDVAGARALAERLERGKGARGERPEASDRAADAWSRLEVVRLHAGARRPAGDLRVYVRRGTGLERA